MPVPSRRRRQTQQQPQREEIPESIFDALNSVDPSGKPIAERQAAQAKGPTIEDLQKQLTELQTRADQAERTNAAINTPVRVEATAPKEPAFKLDDLPDPIADPKAYTTEMAKRTQTYQRELSEFYRAQESVAATQQGNFQNLWQDFASSYADYADDQEGVEFATNKVKKQLERRGVDVNRYMFSNADRFFKEVTKAYDDRFGAPETDEPVRESAPRRDRQPAQRRDVARDGDELPDEANRTAGIFGGIDSSGGNRAPRTPPAGDMIKDLQDLQRKSGYY